MSPGDRAIRSICIAGSGLVAGSAALAFGRALPWAELRLLRTPPDPAALADRLPGTLPTIHRFHAAIGMDELDLVRAGAVTHRLGTRFEHWSASGDPWFNVFGEYGLPTAAVGFHALWHRARAAGRALPFDRYAAAVALARSDRFAHPSHDPNSPLGSFLYALRLEPDRYRDLLDAAAAQRPRLEGEIAGAERRPDGGILALSLKDGRRIAADLFVDCTGPSASILSILDTDFEPWSRWLPCDRIQLSWVAAQPVSPCDGVAAVEYGWRGLIPMIGRSLACRLFSSRFTSSAEPDLVLLAPGRRPRPWIANVLAVGDSAVAVDPLHGANLHLAHSAILRALDLLPGRDCHPVELAEYNRRCELEALRVRDFIALHYLRSGRTQGELWGTMAQCDPPDSLARTLEQFGRRGRLPLFEEESFDANSWLAALFGLGLRPQDVDPVAAGVDLDRAVAAMDSLAARLDALPERIPPYAELLRRMQAGPIPESPEAPGRGP